MNSKILLDRKIIDWEWYGDINTCRVFIHLLIKANWKDKRWQGQFIKRGSLITSIGNLADETSLSIREVRTALEHLVKTGEIDKQTTSRYTLITVLNYNVYQPERQTNDKQTTTTEKGNKGNKDNSLFVSPMKGSTKKSKKFIPPTVEEVRAYCEERGNGIDAETFIAHYATNGWMRGKTKMKNWKMAVVTWEKQRGFEYVKQKKQEQKNNSNKGLEKYDPDNDDRNKQLYGAGYRVNDDGYWIRL